MHRCFVTGLSNLIINWRWQIKTYWRNENAWQFQRHYTFYTKWSSQNAYSFSTFPSQPSLSILRTFNIVEVKVKLPVFLIKLHRAMTYGGVEV